MSPTNGQRPGRRPGQRSGAAAFMPLVVAVCAILVARESMAALLPEVSSWVAFVVALVVGWLAYTAVERWYARRNGPKDHEQ